MTIAGTVIEKMGGAAAVAKITGLHVGQVHRWKWPKERGGCEGRVPSQHQQTLLDYARKHQLPLTPADFFDAPPLISKEAGSSSQRESWCSDHVPYTRRVVS